MQRVGGLPHSRGATRPTKGEHDRLQDFIRAIGNKNLFRADAMERADCGAQFRRRAIGITIPVDALESARERVGPGLGRSIRGFIGIETNGDIDLRRVVALHQRNVVTRSDHDSASSARLRRRTDSACVMNPSASAIAATTGAAASNPARVTSTT